MGFIHFGLRMEIEELYLKWCEEEGVANEPNSFVVFMMLKGWLNEEKIIEDLDHKTENSSEIPNNCEHITEDGVTCAKYPACDDCLDNPLNKVKGSERLVKGSEQTEPTMRLHEWTSDDITFCTAKCEVKCFRKPKYIKHKDIPHSFSDFSNSCVEYEPKDEPTISKMEQVDKDINVRSKDEPQTNADQHVQHVESVEQTERSSE